MNKLEHFRRFWPWQPLPTPTSVRQFFSSLPGLLVHEVGAFLNADDQNRLGMRKERQLLRLTRVSRLQIHRPLQLKY